MNQVPGDSRHAEFDPGVRKVRLHKKAGDELAAKDKSLETCLSQEIDLLSTFLVVLATAGSGLHRYVKKMHPQYGDYVDRANDHHKRAVLYKFGVP